MQNNCVHDLFELNICVNIETCQYISQEYTYVDPKRQPVGRANRINSQLVNVKQMSVTCAHTGLVPELISATSDTLRVHLPVCHDDRLKLFKSKQSKCAFS